MKISKIWDLLNKFKDLCKGRGWKISQTEDWIETKNGYHNFLMPRDINPSSFEKIASKSKCVIREGLSYHVVSPSYTAWLFSQTPPEEITKMVIENPDFSKRVAIYDLSAIAEGRKLCYKINKTNSPVFQEFETFVQNEFKITFKSSHNGETNVKGCTLKELA